MARNYTITTLRKPKPETKRKNKAAAVNARSHTFKGKGNHATALLKTKRINILLEKQNCISTGEHFRKKYIRLEEGLLVKTISDTRER
jgi:hypothetical protein